MKIKVNSNIFYVNYDQLILKLELLLIVLSNEYFRKCALDCWDSCLFSYPPAISIGIIVTLKFILALIICDHVT